MITFFESMHKLKGQYHHNQQGMELECSFLDKLSDCHNTPHDKVISPLTGCINVPVIFSHCVNLRLGHRFHAPSKVCCDGDDTAPLNHQHVKVSAY